MAKQHQPRAPSPQPKQSASQDPAGQRQSLLGRFAEMRANNVAKRPSLAGEGAALFRDAVNDIRATTHQFFYGKSEGPGTPGTPLNPTPQLVTQDLGNFRGFDYDQKLRQAAERGKAHGQHRNQDRGKKGPSR